MKAKMYQDVVAGGAAEPKIGWGAGKRGGVFISGPGSVFAHVAGKNAGARLNQKPPKRKKAKGSK
jgi:hypothetical protein